jgi:hypothetical protein
LPFVPSPLRAKPLSRPMQGQNIIRVFLFAIFFAIGAASVSVSLLCDDLMQYYRNKQLLDAEKELSKKLESLNNDYDALLQQLKLDPNLLRRIAPAVLGTESNDVNTVRPRVTAEQLAAARKAIMEKSKQKQDKATMPKWITRCSEPHRRIMLFVCGAGLVLISFMCFGSPEQTKQTQ